MNVVYERFHNRGCFGLAPKWCCLQSTCLSSLPYPARSTITPTFWAWDHVYTRGKFSGLATNPKCFSTGLVSLERRKANVRNVSFQISLRWPIYIINPVDKTKLSCLNLNLVFFWRHLFLVVEATNSLLTISSLMNAHGVVVLLKRLRIRISFQSKRLLIRAL